MQFANLNYLWLILILPILAVFFWWAMREKKRALEKFAEKALLKHLTQGVSMVKQRIKILLLFVGMLCLVIALIQPQWGFEWVDAKRRGLDIVVALDVSKSMLAEDIRPNRLEAAKREIKSLINMLQGDRIGFVAFAGKAYLECPLTLDYSTAKLFIDHVDVNAIPRGGTNVAEAIQVATKAFKAHEKKHRVLILITDGEDHQGQVQRAVEEAREQGVIIFPIGVGLKDGAPIPVETDTGLRSYVKDRSGNVVLSRLNPSVLTNIAQWSGGRPGTIGTGSFPLEEIYEQEISHMERRDLESTRFKNYQHRFQWFLFLALLLFVTEAVLSERKRQIV